jgi:hypothetical protein
MSPREILMDRSKKLRKAIYKIDESMKNKFPVKSHCTFLKEIFYLVQSHRIRIIWMKNDIF